MPPEVTLYQLENCPFSHRARHQLSVHGASYRLVNVPLDRDRRDELEAISGQRTVPVLVVDGTPYIDSAEIGAQIHALWPSDAASIGAVERETQPVAIVPCDGHSTEAMVERLRVSCAEQGFELHEVDTALPGAQRVVELRGSYVDELVAIEPRVRTTLPIRVLIADHENGLSAQFMRPDRAWLQLRNLSLNRVSWQLNARVEDAVKAAAG